MFKSLLGRLSAGENLTTGEMAEAIQAVMQGEVADGEIGLLLIALREKGETVEEVAGAAMAMRKNMLPIRHRYENLIDTCGPGETAGTFNISTAAAIITAAAGVPVAKHGNRKVTSRTGSADVLAALGVNVEAEIETVEACLEELGLCFCFAQRQHPAMKRVAEVRRKLGVPTIFNLLGPLCNPAGAPYQLLGVARPELRALLGGALQQLGTRRALIVRGDDGLDEVTVCAATQVTEICSDPPQRREFTWTAADFGLEAGAKETLLAADPEESAALIRRVLAGERGTPRDIVVINAAAALWTAGLSATPDDCARRAEEAIDSGTASRLLSKLAERSHR